MDAEFRVQFLSNFVGNEGIRALYTPLKGVCGALIPSFPTKNQGGKGGGPTSASGCCRSGLRGVQDVGVLFLCGLDYLR